MEIMVIWILLVVHSECVAFFLHLLGFLGTGSWIFLQCSSELPAGPLHGPCGPSIWRYLMSSCLFVMPAAFEGSCLGPLIHLGLQNGDILIPLFILHFLAGLLFDYTVYSLYRKGRINAWLSPFINFQNNNCLTSVLRQWPVGFILLYYLYKLMK